MRFKMTAKVCWCAPNACAPTCYATASQSPNLNLSLAQYYYSDLALTMQPWDLRIYLFLLLFYRFFFNASTPTHPAFLVGKNIGPYFLWQLIFFLVANLFFSSRLPEIKFPGQ